MCEELSGCIRSDLMYFTLTLVVGKIFSWVLTHQRSIIRLVYPWYTNTEHNKSKDKINSFTHRLGQVKLFGFMAYQPLMVI